MNEISNAIRIQNLIKFFEDKEILKSVSFAIKKGTIHGFIGPNGAGKTTVIRALVGLVIPNGGEIFINEKLLPYGFSTDKNIGYISSEPKFPEITVKEYMELVEYLTGIELESKFTGSLLYEFKDKLCKELSTGWKKMLQILVLSLRKPKIIIADEPFNGLDPTFRMNLMKNLVKAKEEGKTIFISTHILNDLEKIADDITMIKEGEIIYSGRKDEDIEEKYEKLFFDPEKANNFSL